MKIIIWLALFIILLIISYILTSYTKSFLVFLTVFFSGIFYFIPKIIKKTFDSVEVNNNSDVIKSTIADETLVEEKKEARNKESDCEEMEEITRYFLNNNDHSFEYVNRHGSRCFNKNLTPGEGMLVWILRKELNTEDYFIFNNIIIPNKETVSSQIDHLIISKYGVFVLENKDFSGWIFGSKNSNKWLQRFWNGKSFSFQNPLKQNYAHIKALQKVTGIRDKNIFNIVAFSHKASFRKERIKNVLFYDEIPRYIKKNKIELMTKDRLEHILGKLFVMCQTVNINDEEHVQNIKKHVKNKDGN